jgi:hypothetical protein
MLPFYSFSFVLLLGCASLYYRAAEIDGASGMLWAGLSVLISVVAWRCLCLGSLGILVGQFGLFAGITLVRTYRKS